MSARRAAARRRDGAPGSGADRGAEPRRPVPRSTGRAPARTPFPVESPVAPERIRAHRPAAAAAPPGDRRNLPFGTAAAKKSTQERAEKERSMLLTARRSDR
ncbi:hypothetical protein Maq22A_c28595 [Methylobacterium aquaticum]|uniref:Uncharacterized protein n=1 Tax=Methylobacterium aquaticum TaxID=270351 RepID=A0A1Y0ZGV3_9HYPH|nr:hypothetical protein Maq22A_c28595 [Methylobacterium aquaticum]